MGDGFQRVPGRRQRPIVQGVGGMIAAVLILGGGLLAGRLLTDEPPHPPPSPDPSPVPSLSSPPTSRSSPLR
ncbi:hypothetical protein [Actinoplanes derwentensis]|uniref:Uncharacterized protein n=1 Tax=Actinoplanes derwentensis TaxID=113562 RepID=A0A1H2D695_9ACTN|nr:hypothetical protein [Actinoplanes derwentensis]GID85593.1 hypothetical protein Ade03nite_45170 [Actinoplanes derwentensis]SDT78260.1 hypothetical protein SAMN04489716_8298 [Actinoplanes derwentensis]